MMFYIDTFHLMQTCQETQPTWDKGDSSFYENKGQIVKKARNSNLPEDCSRFTHAKVKPQIFLEK